MDPTITLFQPFLSSSSATKNNQRSSTNKNRPFLPLFVHIQYPYHLSLSLSLSLSLCSIHPYIYIYTGGVFDIPMAMENYNRSRSYSYSHGNDMMQMESYHGPQRPPTSSYELRSYSTSYAQTQMANTNRGFKLKKGKGNSGSSSSKSWSLDDPEFQRKKRVASYKMYSVEGKVKGTFRKSFRWLKDRYTQVMYGWW